MKSKHYELDMTEGSIFKNTLLYVLPLIFGNILQLLYNAADIVVVGRWAGSTATASVGATSSLNGLIVNFCVGLSIGTSIVVSRRYGAHKYDDVRKATHTGITIGLLSGILAMIAGILLSRPALELMGTPEGDVLDGAVLYMRIYFCAVPGLLVYNFGAAILRAVGDTKRPLYILSASGIINVLLNMVFVVKFNMGVAGVATATGISSYISAFAVMYILIKTDTVCKINLKALKLYPAETKETLLIGLPAGIQSSIFAISNTVIQSAVNSFGEAAVAGCAAAGSIEGFVYTSMHAFNIATVTSVSQNYGAQQEKRIYKTIAISTACVTFVGMLLGFSAAYFSKELLGIYLTDSPEAIEYGSIRIIYTSVPYFLCGIMEILSGSLRGLGYSTSTMFVSLVGVCGFRLLWVFFILPLQRSLQTLFLCWSVSWIIVIIIYVIFFIVVRKSAMKHMYE